jgi:hypothetical protein
LPFFGAAGDTIFGVPQADGRSPFSSPIPAAAIASLTRVAANHAKADSPTTQEASPGESSNPLDRESSREFRLLKSGIQRPAE